MAASVGAFFHPHLTDPTLAARGLLDHLVVTDPGPVDAPLRAALSTRFRLVLHGLADGLPEDPGGAWSGEAAALAAGWDPLWVTEALHPRPADPRGDEVDLEVAPAYAPDLLPGLVRAVRALRSAVGRPVGVVPGPARLALPVPVLAESAFLRRLLAESDGALVLDAGHAWLSARQGGVAPETFVAELPLERLVELRVTAVEPDRDLGGPWLAAGVPGPALLELARRIADRAPALRAVTLGARSAALRWETVAAGIHALRGGLGLPS